MKIKELIELLVEFGMNETISICLKEGEEYTYLDILEFRGTNEPYLTRDPTFFVEGDTSKY